MPAAINQANLLMIFDKELSKLRSTLGGIDADTARKSLPDDDTTVKGVIAHRIHWMGLFHKWFDDGAAGRTVHLPDEGVKWNQLRAYNAPIYARGDAADWRQLQSDFDAACAKLRAFIADHDPAKLYAQGAYDWTGKWTLGRYAEAAGPSHFRSANTYIRKVLRAAT